MKALYGDLSNNLPTEAFNKGYFLEWEEPQKVDPVFLRDKRGTIVYRWDYVPSLTEVFEVCGKIAIEPLK